MGTVLKERPVLKVIKQGENIYLGNPNETLGFAMFSAPSNFSITDNMEETINYFNQVITAMHAKNFYGGNLVFDLSKVDTITVDAIMYMNALALSKLASDKKMSLFMPTKKKVFYKIQRSGLCKYLAVTDSIMDKNIYQINGGKLTDTEIAKSISDFSSKFLFYKRRESHFIYNTFIELMNNTCQHAYNDLENKLWYIFVENGKNSIKYIFLDIGIGIPDTMRKAFADKIDDLLPIIEENDSYFIYEALKGDIKRSATSLVNRNAGLPEIYQYYLEKKTSNLKIISRKGVCQFYDSNRRKPVLKNLKNSFQGTLFIWEVRKGVN